MGGENLIVPADKDSGFSTTTNKTNATIKVIANIGIISPQYIQVKGVSGGKSFPSMRKIPFKVNP